MSASVIETAGAPPLPLARQYRVIGLICTGHFTAHLFVLTLPPLIPFMKADLGISYAALGFLVTLYLVASATVQVPVGMLVDRIGARRVLVAGLLLMGVGFTAAGLVNSYWAMAAAIVCAGMGNSVFHPSDFVILSSSVEKGRLGRAFGLHGLAGSSGSALAPVIMLILASRFGWQTALVCAGLFAVAVSVLMFLSGAALRQEAEREKPADGAPGQLRRTIGLLSSRTILSYFMFFIFTAAAHGAITSFSVVVLSDVYGAELSFANGVLSGFLVMAVIGVAIGGFVADRIRRHDRVLVICFAISALSIGVVASGLAPLWAIAGAIGIAGFMRGLVSPSRDLLARNAAPAGMLGTVMAVLTVGFTTGGSIIPVICGWLLDIGSGGAVFWLSVVMMGCAIASVFVARERSL